MNISFHKVTRIEIERCTQGDTHWLELRITEDNKKPTEITLFAASDKAHLTLHEVA